MKRIIGFFILLINICGVFSQAYDLKFKNFSIENGLSHNNVECIFQDSKGFIWIGTADGLNKYDGYSYKIYRPGTENYGTSISSSYIFCIFEDSQGDIWFGTDGRGISRYCYKEDKFSNYDSFTGNGLNPEVINEIVEDDNKNLWIGTIEGLYRHNINSGKFIKADPENILKNSLIKKMLINEGILWIATEENGLFTYNLKTSEISQLKDKSIGLISCIDLVSDSILLIGTRNNGLHSYNIKTGVIIPSYLNSRFFKNFSISFIDKDSQNNIWICSENGGLFKLSITGKFLQAFQNDDNNAYSLSNNSISCFLEDADGNFWFGTRGSGFDFASKNEKAFRHISHVKNTTLTMSSNNVKCFSETSEGNILIGTDGGGMNIYNPVNSTVENQVTNKFLRNITAKNILKIAKDKKNNYWLSTWDKGINYLDKARKIHKIDFKLYKNAPQVNTIFDLIVDSQNRIWFSAFNEGLFIYDPDNNKFENLTYQLPYNSRFVSAIKEDSKNNIWIGSYGKGLVMIKGDSYKYYDLQQITMDSTIRSMQIFCLHEDSEGNIWVGSNNGLYLLDRINDRFLHFSQISGFLNNSVLAILEDDHNNFWISTNAGISVFNLKQKVFKNYNVYDGLQSNQFNPQSALKLSSGYMIFGGINGFTYFHPDSIKDNPKEPRVYITNIKINNNDVLSVSGYDQIKYNPIYLKNLTLDSQQKSVAFSFVALNYLSTAKNRYLYKLEGFDNDWIKASPGREATYTNLNPGNYTFRVKACNNDGVWNETGQSIALRVKPPIWKTWWAFGIYCIVLVWIFILVRNMLLFRATMKSKLDYDSFKSRKRQELDNMKLKFFTNISHEFRTPLTLILGPVDRILSLEKDELKKGQLLIVKRNADRLLRLVNQIMDIRKIDAGEIKFNPSHEDVIPFLKNIFESFQEQASEMNLLYTFNSDVEKIVIDFDPDKLDKVVFNILSNAFKFTNPGGKISVKVSLVFWSDDEFPQSKPEFREPNYLEIKIFDTGQGIPENKIEKIFNRFYQVEGGKSEMQEGTGIGLSLAKELVDMHHGRILIDSELGKGSSFKVLLPYHPEDSHLAHTNSDYNIQTEESNEDEDISKIEEEALASIILVVEDNSDMRTYICDNLKHKYSMLEASNGEEGLKLALKKIPDVIISDIMMPIMNGLELCRKVKSDDLTSHIPVILLTAKTSEESKIEGISEGADEYISKPFSINLLEAKIKTLINNRKRLKEIFAKQIKLDPSDITITSADEKFLLKALKTIEENISNHEFSVEMLSEQVGFSRVHLYRKLSALTDTSPNEFIKSIRLKRAAQLLAQKKINVSEVCYEVGFQDPKYFSKCFKKQFGVLPSEYKSPGTES